MNEELPSVACASTDMLVVNDFSKNASDAADFAEFVTVQLADVLHDMSGHYSVFLSQNASDAEKLHIRHMRMPFYCRIPRMQKTSG